MNRILTIEAVVIIFLVVIIGKVPSRNISAYNNSGNAYEHMAEISDSDKSSEITSVAPEENRTLVSISRPMGGYNAYVNGSFVEPLVTPEPTVTPDADVTGDDSNVPSPEPTVTPVDAWTSPDKSDTIDTGYMARTNDQVKVRATPYTNDDSNVYDIVKSGREYTVTNTSVNSNDSNVTKWVEILYEDKVGYVSAEYVELIKK